MRSDIEIRPSPRVPLRFRKTLVWRWALFGFVVVLALAAMDVPVWVYAVGLMAWAAAGVQWLWDSALEHDGLPHQQPTSLSAPVEAPVWQEWVSGWYWETDPSHCLCCLRPGTLVDDALRVDWQALSAFLASRPPWLSCWHGSTSSAGHAGSRDADFDEAERDPSHQAALARIAYLFDQQAGWSEALRLPWPHGIEGLAVEEGWCCAVRARPRWDARGTFLGFHGVLVPVPPGAASQGADAGGGVAAAVEHSIMADQAAALAAEKTATELREAEQEALGYALSHDLRAPLRVVEGFTRIVKEDYGKALDRLAQDHLDRVLAAATRMNGMIDAILAQAQLAGTCIQRVRIDLSAMAREIGEETAAAGHNSATQLLVDGGMHVEADPALVRRVLENLIGNAYKYSAKVAAPKVEVGVMPATNPAVFFVRDNGAGFDMQHADKLFGMFQRLHSTKEFPGTGVGLAGVHNIVRRHGGRIWAEAKPGEGACFYFTLMDTLEAQRASMH